MKENKPVLMALAVILAVLVVAATWAGHALFNSKIKGIPVAKGSLHWLPFGLGGTLEFTKNPVKFLAEQREKLGNVFVVNLVAFPCVFVLGVKGQTKFFRASNDVLNFDDGVVHSLGDIAKEGYSNREWLKLSNPMITKGFMKSERQPLFNQIGREESQRVLAELAQLDHVDLFKVVSATVLRVAIRAMAGERFAERHAAEIIPVYQQFEVDLVNPLGKVVPSYIPLPVKKRLQAAKRMICKYVKEEVDERLGEMRAGKKMPNDYLQLLLDECGEKFADSYTSHLLFMIMAAHTNTAGTTSWTLSHLFLNEKNVARARQEIQSVLEENGVDMASLGDHGSPTALPPFSKFPYLSSCLKETGRRYSITILIRKCNAPIEIEGVVIQPGNVVAASPLVTSMGEDLYENPSKYDPDRWTTPPKSSSATTSQDKIAARPGTGDIVLPQFGAGKHPCLGEKFALNVMQMFLFTALMQYDMKILPVREEGTGGDKPVHDGEAFQKLFPPDFLTAVGTPWPERPVVVKFSKRQ